jgi:hypothetical protein
MESTSTETDSPVDSSSVARDLEARLREKEQLVAVLTERLEQAAEQLDRNRRTGADRGMRVSGGMPAEVIEQQKSLSEDLRRAVEHLGDMQVPATLGRIEIQITELRDLIASRTTEFAAAAPGAMPAGTAFDAHPESSTAGVGDDAADNEQPGSWAAMKASLLEADETPAEPSEEVDSVEELLAAIEEIDLPAAIDWEAADADGLSEAVRQRDDYIDYLLKKLRLVSARQRTLPDWEALENVPEEMQTQLQELADRFEEGLRFAEVESSLERARLGREQARLDALQSQIDKAAKRLGIDLEGDSDETSAPEAKGNEEDAQGSRWRRMLGVKKGGASAD